ncbi:SNF family Na+-dependent transporter [Flavobacterium sp. HSC-61S13]|nr:SNF family Na+-dependent transporter [Flavobacterium sp. HSC-61S13]
MEILYIGFFIILDFLIFNYLTKTVQYRRNICVLLVTLLCLFTALHFANPLGLAIPNHLFFILTTFSLVLFVFHVGKKISLWLLVRINNERNKNMDMLTKSFSYLIDYATPILILIFQLYSIIDNY